MKTLIALAFSLCVSSFCLAQDLHSQISFGINSIRSSQGLGTLKRDPRLDNAARSQSDWMRSVGRMDHLRECATGSVEEFMVCNYHPANRIINSGYFSFEELFVVERGGGGSVVRPKPIADENLSEIIAAGWGDEREIKNPQTILNGWMNSPGHKRAILTPHFKDFGVAISTKRGETYWCVVFATREK